MTVVVGDCRETMRGMEPDSIDAIVSDPPYGLSFMGKGWDRGVPGVEFWTEALRVARPGSYLLAFGGTRTFHRLGVAIEDAGFEVHDCLSWLYGSGFPKHRSKLKPAWEPIILARKPAKYATPLNVDACRIGTETRTTRGMSSLGVMHDDDWKPRDVTTTVSGRWPANVVLDEEASHFPESRYFYCAKASRAEREAGLEGMEERATQCAVGMPLVTAAKWGDPEQKVYERRTKARNHHPTVKPVALMRWHVRLVTPPNGLVLDPFTGSGTTGVACVHEGRRFVGCELSEEYAAIARARIAHAVETVEPSLEVA